MDSSRPLDFSRPAPPTGSYIGGEARDKIGSNSPDSLQVGIEGQEEVQVYIVTLGKARILYCVCCEGIKTHWNVRFIFCNS